MNVRDACELVEPARKKHDVPGVTAAFYAGGEFASTACGVTNLSTGVGMTVDSIAHVGSITKVLTATLLMQLVDRGEVQLDAPVANILPEFRLRDSEATAAITVQMLLDHTSGMGANLLPDQGHDLETLSQTFARVICEPQLHAPGEARSYCNAALVVAGYLCQRLARTSWYDLIKERLFEPLDLRRSAVLPEDALLYRASVGHFANLAGQIARTSHAFLPLGFAAAGATNMMSATDLMTFARTHLNGGVGPNGARILSEDATHRMRDSSGSPGPATFDSGLGWRRFNGLVGHGGGGPGIVSYLSMHPESQTAVVVLTNAEHGLGVLQDVISPFMKAHSGLDPLPALPAPRPDLAFDAAAYAGTFENNTVVHEVTAAGGELYWTAAVKHRYYDSSHLEKPPAVKLVPVAPDWFVADASASPLTRGSAELVGFLGRDSGRARFLAQQLWLFRRTGG